MGIHFGVDYYPEHWYKERWETDARLMEEMGVRVVRMAEFSWHKIEPSDGVFDFSWLDRAIALLARHGISTVLGTPTAAPPAWLCNAHPEILPIDHDGRKRGFGGRHHDCQSSSVYRRYVSRIVAEMSSHYADNPSVIGWQIDNELGNSHSSLCHCDSCRHAFQGWLERKYGTVENLNKAWGNAFWSQEVNSFDEVYTPGLTVTGENPSAVFDWRLFHSDLIVDFLKSQVDIIRKNCPGHFITHNLMGFADVVSYYDLAKALDFVSHDQYPSLYLSKKPQTESYELAAALDVVRAFKRKAFWIMEQQSGITGWEIMGRAPEPGQLALWSMQSIAHGADCVVYFRWRVSPIGTEQYWHGILPHSGIPGRRYYELKDFISSVSPLMDELAGKLPMSEVAIVYSYRQRYAMDIQRHNPELSYLKQLLKYYKVLYEKNADTDFVSEEDALSPYKLVIAPLLYITDTESEDRLMEYVSRGGTLLLTMRTGVKDKSNLCMIDRELPGRLFDVCGLEVVDYDCLYEAECLVDFKGETYKADKWADILCVSDETEVLAVYKSGFYKGTPVITRHRYGEGVCYYVGTEPSDELMTALVSLILDESGISGLGETLDGIELSSRGDYLFALNHTGEEKEIKIKKGYHAVLGGSEKLSPYGFAVFKHW